MIKVKLNSNFGYDSNGEEIDESTVEELCRITNEIVNEKVKNPKNFDYIDVDEDSFKNSFYFANGAHVNYELIVKTSSDELDISDCYKDRWDGLFVQISQNNGHAVVYFKFTLDVQNADIKFGTYHANVYEIDANGREIFSQYYTNKFDEAVDINKVFEKIRAQLEPAVRDALITISNL